jgi:hypothetical protein
MTGRALAGWLRRVEVATRPGNPELAETMARRTRWVRGSLRRARLA